MRRGAKAPLFLSVIWVGGWAGGRAVARARGVYIKQSRNPNPNPKSLLVMM